MIQESWTEYGFELGLLYPPKNNNYSRGMRKEKAERGKNELLCFHKQNRETKKCREGRILRIGGNWRVCALTGGGAGRF